MKLLRSLFMVANTFFLFIPSCPAQLFNSTDRLALQQDLLNSNYETITHFFRQKDTLLESGDMKDQFETEIYKWEKLLYLNLLSKIAAIPEYPQSEIQKLNQNYLDLSEDFSPKHAGQNALIAYQEFLETLEKQQNYAANIAYRKAVFLRYEYIQFAHKLFHHLIDQITFRLEEDGYNAIKNTESELDSVFKLIENPDGEMIAVYRKIGARIVKAKNWQETYWGSHISKRMAIYVGSSINFMHSRSTEFVAEYQGTNLLKQGEIYTISLNQPAIQSIRVMTTFEHRIRSSLYVGIELTFGQSIYKFIDGSAIIYHPNSQSYSQGSKDQFRDLTLHHFSHLFYAHYIVHSKNRYSTFLRIGLGQSFIQKDKMNAINEIYRSAPYTDTAEFKQHLDADDEFVTDFEIGIGIELFRVLGQRFTSRLFVAQKFSENKTYWLDNMPFRIELNFGYAWK